jgi:hypothetical protein
MAGALLGGDVDVRRVGARLACLCGCTDTFATCSMLECHFCKPGKERIAKMQAAGMADQAIIDAFVKEYGQRIYRAAPQPWGRLVPYLAMIPGLFLIWWFVRRYYHPRPVVAGTGGDMVDLDDPALKKYKDQIEKDVAGLD